MCVRVCVRVNLACVADGLGHGEAVGEGLEVAQEAVGQAASAPFHPRGQVFPVLVREEDRSRARGPGTLARRSLIHSPALGALPLCHEKGNTA